MGQIRTYVYFSSYIINYNLIIVIHSSRTIQAYTTSKSSATW
nr:MAG TPA: hypothetical protein [Caudoviricetes sp.]